MTREEIEEAIRQSTGRTTQYDEPWRSMVVTLLLDIKNLEADAKRRRNRLLETLSQMERDEAEEAKPPHKAFSKDWVDGVEDGRMVAYLDCIALVRKLVAED